MGFEWAFDGVAFREVESVQRSGPQNAFVEHSYPGVDGVDSVAHGFRGEFGHQDEDGHDNLLQYFP